MDKSNPPALPLAVAAILGVFDKHASKGGDPTKLSVAEAKELIREQMGPMCEEAKNQPDVTQILQSMDFDGDGEMDIMEFMTFLTCYACACYGKVCEMKGRRK
ncbi:hypothetical protein NL108_015339 [Boleophthalmus pectinirostris]|uniref:protein S100-B-like n=1 Tax=Boleophthalmus pectinirostris TaxID=150288 RepID=UPI00242E1ADF|nr:protein S100-B-like [Boleophthalmus pectinirostris]KAJ0055907.1 hypothetical protein NL108_015339 [Boleophthalmus pectinirostris]